MTPEFPRSTSSRPPELLDLAVIGGGAAGFFTAIQFAEMAPGREVAIFEKGNQFLQKVRISGGGRCNVTHACFDPEGLSTHYPRGMKELRFAFHRWQARDTVEWFANHGVELKTEADGRMFPVTDSSETIIECFMERARDYGIALRRRHALARIELEEEGTFTLYFGGSEAVVRARAVCIAVGSLKGSAMLSQLEKLGQETRSLVPSLFAFNVSDKRISGLAGVTHPHVSIRSETSSQPREGALLITHRGFSGPAVLRLSAWEARELAGLSHRFSFWVDWLPELSAEMILKQFASNRQEHGAKLVRNHPLAPISRRLWERLVQGAGIEDGTTWAQLPKSLTQKLLDELKSSHFKAEGKTTNKDEFVTCGGIDRKAINFQTMQSRSLPGLYFAGECLDIDGVTGGFNFQAAWTTAHIAATSIAANVEG